MEKPALNIGKNIRRLREKNGLSQAELARKLGLSQKVISAYERNYRLPPSSLIPHVAETLGASTDDLYKSSDDDPPTYRLRNPQRWEIVEKLEAIPESERKAVYALIERYLEEKKTEKGKGQGGA